MMGKKITSYDQLKNGMKVKGSFGLWDKSSAYNLPEGVIFFDQEKDEYYLLQNIRAGDEPANDIWRNKGYECSWGIYKDLRNVELEIVEEKEEEQTLFDSLEVGDIVEFSSGNKYKVLEKFSNTVLLSDSHSFTKAGNWYTNFELERFGVMKVVETKANDDLEEYESVKEEILDILKSYASAAHAAMGHPDCSYTVKGLEEQQKFCVYAIMELIKEGVEAD